MRILFITATRIGDAVLSTGVLRYLVDTYPTARFTIACGPLAASLFAAVPRLDDIIVLDKRPMLGHWLALWRRTRGTRWDMVIDLRRSLTAYFLRANSRRILGRTDDTRHRAAFLPSVLGLTAPLPLHIYGAAEHSLRALQLIPDGPSVLAVAPIAAKPEKTWPIDRFMAAVACLTAAGGPCAGWRVAVVGSREDAARARELLAAIPPIRRLALFGEPDLLTVHAALKRCAAFVGNDSGTAHLAAAAGIPTLAIFGPTDPTHYAPWAPKAGVVRAPGGVLNDLDADTVATAVGKLLEVS